MPDVTIDNVDELIEAIEGSVRPLSSGPNLIGRVAPARRIVRASFNAAAAGDYAAADVVSNSVTDTLGVALRFVNVVDSAGQVAVLDSVNVVGSEDSLLWRLRLHWYDYNPAPADVEMDDNIAFDFAKTAAGAARYLGYTDIPAMADRGTAASQAQVGGLRQLLPTGATAHLWAVVQTLDAEANETAAMLLRFDLGFLN